MQTTVRTQEDATTTPGSLPMIAGEGSERQGGMFNHASRNDNGHVRNRYGQGEILIEHVQ